MKNLSKKLISLLLCLVMVLQLLPASVFAIELPWGKHDGLILEFRDENAMRSFRMLRGGEELGGNMLLVEGSYKEAADYEKMDGIVSVTYNYTFETAAYKGEYDAEPDDTYFAEQMYPGSKNMWYNLASNTDNFTDFEYTTIRVGVLDTGIDGTHEDLMTRVVAGYDAVYDAKLPNGLNSDVSYDSHGTMVAGLIAAEAYNGKGIAGMTGKLPVELVPIRALGANGKGKVADIVRGIYWAIDNDIDIINMSFGSRLSYYPAALGTAVKAATESGLLLIAAAGNEGDKTIEGYYPACIDGVYPVVSSAGVDSSEKASYSNDVPSWMKDFYYLGFDYAGCCGTDLWTTAAGNHYEKFTGTSASCAVITGYWAAMLTVTGGRDNPFVYRDLGEIVNRAMGGFATYRNYYNITPSTMASGMYNITQEMLDLKNNKIQARVLCKDLLSGTEEVVASIPIGRALVGDVTLRVLNENETVIYTCNPVANDGSDPNQYTFSVDTTKLPDTDVTLELRIRTKQEVAENAQIEYVSNIATRKVAVQNSLASSNAVVKIYDEDGNEIYTNVQVIDPATGELLQTLTFDTGTGVASNKVKYSAFKGGQLTFGIYGQGILYELTSGFAHEIKLGTEAQLTQLQFRNSAVTLANAKVYAQTHAGITELGTTDENGDLSVLMMNGTYQLYAMDPVNRYFLACTAVQNGDRLEISFADAVSDVVELTVGAAEKLSAYDYYSIGFADREVDNLSDMAVMGWISAKTPKVFVTPGSYYMMVGIYDAFFPEGSADVAGDHRYAETVHIIGQKKLTAADSVTFDPTVLKADLVPEANEVLYGEALQLTFRLTDDQGYKIISGSDYYATDFGKLYEGSRWESGNWLDVLDSEGTKHYNVEYDVTGGTFDTVSRFEPLEYKAEDYQLAQYFYFYEQSNWEKEEDLLAYQSIIDQETVSVKLGPVLTITVEQPSDGYHNVESVSTIIDGKETDLKQFSDDGGTCTYSANKLVNGSPLFIRMLGYDGTNMYRYYVLAEYRADNPYCAVSFPSNVGTFSLTYGDSFVEYLPVKIPTEYGDFSFTLYSCAYDNTYVNAGTYDLSGMVYVGDDQECWAPIYLAFSAELEVLAGTHVELALGGDDPSQVLVYNPRSWESQLSFAITVDGKTQPVNPFTDSWIPDPIIVAKTPEVDEVLITYALIPELVDNWEGNTLIGDGVEYTMAVNFDAAETYLDPLTFTGMTAEPAKSAFTANEDVQIDISAYVNEAMIMRSMAKKHFVKTFTDDDHRNYTLTYEILKEYLPVAKYRVSGGSWVDVSNVSWSGVNLGKLEEGEYEIQFELEADPEVGIDPWSAHCVFTVGEAEIGHHINIYAPETAADEAQVTLTGTAGATVVVHYTTPDGEEKTLPAITMPENGRYSLLLALEAEGNYQLWATSTVTAGETSDTVTSAVILLTCDLEIPNTVSNFKVTAQGNNALKLTWDQVTDASKVWIFRENTCLGYLSTELCEYLDTGLSADRNYTYYIRAENDLGILGNASYATARPTVTADTTAPSVPVQLTGQVDGTTVSLSWTRSTDDVGIAFYRLYRDGALIAETAKRSYEDKGLTKNTTYTYTVSAVDTTGNESEKTAGTAVTTAEKYALQDVSATIEVNRLGNITGNSLDIFANAGQDATNVYAKIVFVRKNGDGSSEQKTESVALARAGYYWRTVWDVSDVLSIQSVKIFAYENENEIGIKECEGFPSLVSSPVVVRLHIPNAQYAPDHFKGATLVLTDQVNNLVWSKEIDSAVELCEYEFTGLSPSTYSLKFMLNGEAIYYERDIELESGIGIFREIKQEGLIRIKSKSGDVMYTIPGKYMQLTDGNYLALRTGPSAFWVESSVTMERNVQEMMMSGSKMYRVPASFTIQRKSGVYEYELPAYEDLETLNAIPVKINLTTPYSDTNLAGMQITILGSKANRATYQMQAMADENGCVQVVWPMEYTKTLTVTQARCGWKDVDGNSITFTGASKTFKDVPTDSAFETTLALPELKTVELQLSVNIFDTTHLVGTVRSGGTSYRVEFGGADPLVMPVRWDYSTNTATFTTYGGIYDGYIYPAQTVTFHDPVSSVSLKNYRPEEEDEVPVYLGEKHDVDLGGAKLTIADKYGEESRFLLSSGLHTITLRSEAHKKPSTDLWYEGRPAAGATLRLSLETPTHSISGVARVNQPGFTQLPPNIDDYYYEDEEGVHFNSEGYYAAVNAYEEDLREYWKKYNDRMLQYRTEGICFEATLKLPFVNLKEGQYYQVLIYDNGAPSSPMMEVSDQVVNTTSPTAYLHGSYFDDNYGVTVVVFPLQGSSTPDGYNVRRFADVPLSAWQDYEGVDIFQINNFANPASHYRLSDVKTVMLGVTTDLAGNDITDQVSVTRYLAGQLLCQEELSKGSELILYDYDNDFAILIPEKVVGEERIARYLEHEGTLCLRVPLNDTITQPIHKQFGYQSKFKVELRHSSGETLVSDMCYFSLYGDGSNETVGKQWWKGAVMENSGFLYGHYVDYWPSNQGAYTIQVKDPLAQKQEILAGCLNESLMKSGGNGLEEGYGSNYDFWKKYGVCHELDITKLQTETIILYTESEYAVLLTNAATMIDVTTIDDNNYQVVMLQQVSDQSDLLLSLPKNAEITFGNVNSDGMVLIPKDTDTTNRFWVMFQITREDALKDPYIRLYTASEDGVQLLDSRFIDYPHFQLSYGDTISSNEVVYSGPGVSVELPSSYFGEFFGSHAKHVYKYYGSNGKLYTSDGPMISTGSGKVNGWYEYVDHIDEAMDLETYLKGGYSFGLGAGLVFGFDGRYIAVQTPVDDFTVAMKVDDEDVLWHVQSLIDSAVADSSLDCSFLWPNQAVTHPISPSSSGSGGFGGSVGGVTFVPVIPDTDDAEEKESAYKDGYIYFPADFLAKYGLYDPAVNMAYLPVGMREPDAYPHTYDIDIRFRYKDTDGEIKEMEFMDEAITVYKDAPVLKKMVRTIYYGLGTTTTFQKNANLSYADREDITQQILLGMSNSNMVKIEAWFDKPLEVYNVIAVSDVPSTAAGPRTMELHYDEEAGCYTGIGILGDSMHMPGDIYIDFEYVDHKWQDNMVPLSVNDVVANLEKRENQPAAKNYTESAPDNGWTLAQTYEAWQKYAELGADGELSEADIAAITDDNGRLYYPKYTFYDEDDNITGTRQDYLDFNCSAENQYSYDLALVEKGEKLATLSYGATVHNDNQVTFTVSSDDPTLIAPMIELDEMQTAGLGTVLRNFFPVIGKAMPEVPKVFQLTSDIMTVGGVVTAGLGVANAITNEWYADLPPDAQVAYDSYRLIDGLGASALTGLGATNGVFGTVAGVFDCVMSVPRGMVDAKYQKIAEAYQEYLRTRETYHDAIRNQDKQLTEWLDKLDELYNGDPDWLAKVDWQEFFDYFFPNRYPDFYFPYGKYHDITPFIALTDPSGYVFEGTQSNRLAGVTATVYQYDTVKSEWVVWDSAAFGEGPSTQITDEKGEYGWDVSEGKWKVVFTKDGYTLAESAELEVPPEHLDVYVGMVAGAPAQVTGVENAIGENNERAIKFTFDRPVLIADVQKLAAVLFNGEPVEGAMTALDGDTSSNGNKSSANNVQIEEGLQMAKTFLFVPTEEFETGSSVMLRCQAGILTYNGMECEAYDSDYVVIPAAAYDPITEIGYTGADSFKVNETLDLRSGLQLTGSQGALQWQAFTADVATVNSSGIATAKRSGDAVFLVTCGDVSCVITVTVETEGHTCVFDRKVATEAYLEKNYPGSTPDSYYYSCACGAYSNDTWRNIPDGHTHTLTQVAAVAATCTETGRGGYYICSCGMAFADAEATEEIVYLHLHGYTPALGHSFRDGTCSRCGAIEAERYAVYAGKEVVGTYANLQTALENMGDGYIRMLCNDVVDITTDKNVRIDLSGYTLEGLTVTGTLYAFDSTATKTTAGFGSAKVTGTVAKDHTVNGVRYIALESDGVYTFHVLELNMTHVTLRTDAAGIYYKAAVTCDPVLQAAIGSYGVALSLNAMPGADFATASGVSHTQVKGAPVIGEAFTSGSVFGIFKDGLKSNTARGEMKIYANAYLQLTDGTVLMSNAQEDVVGWSLREVVEAVDTQWATLDAAQKEAITAMYEKFGAAMEAWNIPNLKQN